MEVCSIVKLSVGRYYVSLWGIRDSYLVKALQRSLIVLSLVELLPVPLFFYQGVHISFSSDLHVD